MADNSGYPSKQMKVSLARRQAQNKIQRLYARATNQETEAQPEEVDLPFPPTAGSQEGAPLNQDEPAPPSK
uniref:Uncharacterized protein n=2 Tax=Oryza TaxID=4527 RepID=A0A0D3EP26_9ORYZ